MTSARATIDPASRRPLRPEDLRPRQQPAADQLPSVARFAQRLADAAGQLYADLGSLSPRVTLDGIREETMTVVPDGAIWFDLAAVGRKLRMCCCLDRPATFALCEAAMGGTGTEDPFDDRERPLSRIERALRDRWCMRFRQNAADCLSQVTGKPVTTVVRDDKAGDPGEFEETEDLEMMVFRFLINLFGYSGELLLAGPRADLLRLFASAGTSGDDAASAGQSALRHALGESQGDIRVALHPETMQVKDVAGLRRGSLLRLAARMSDPVIVSSGDQPIFSALLESSADRLSIRLLAPLR